MLALVSTRTNDGDLTHSDRVHVNSGSLSGQTGDADLAVLSDHFNCLLDNGVVASCVENDLGGPCRW